MAETQIYELRALNDATPWFDTSSGDEGFQFQGVISGTLAVVLESANDPTYASKSDSVLVETYIASFNKIADPPLPRFIRFRVTSFTSGSVKVGLGVARGSRGVASIRPESKAPTQETA